MFQEKIALKMIFNKNTKKNYLRKELPAETKVSLVNKILLRSVSYKAVYWMPWRKWKKCINGSCFKKLIIYKSKKIVSKELIMWYTGSPENPRFSKDVVKRTFSQEQTQNFSTDLYKSCEEDQSLGWAGPCQKKFRTTKRTL